MNVNVMIQGCNDWFNLLHDAFNTGIITDMEFDQLTAIWVGKEVSNVFANVLPNPNCDMKSVQDLADNFVIFSKCASRRLGKNF